MRNIKHKFLSATLILITLILTTNSVLAATAGFYVQPNGKEEVYDIGGGKFRHVTGQEAGGISNFWSLVKKFDPNSVPLFDKAGDGKVIAVLFNREAWVQDGGTFNNIFGSSGWSRVKQPLKGPDFSIGDSVKVTSTVNLRNSSCEQIGSTSLSAGTSTTINGSPIFCILSNDSYRLQKVQQGWVAGMYLQKVSAPAPIQPGVEVLVTPPGSNYIEKTSSQTVTISWATANLSGSNYTVSCSVLQGSVNLNCPPGWPVISSQKNDSRSFQTSGIGTGTLVFTISVSGAIPVSATVVVNPLPLEQNQQHRVCNQDKLCVVVDGAGADTCTTDASCQGQPPPGGNGDGNGDGEPVVLPPPVIIDFWAENSSPSICTIDADPTFLIAPRKTATLSWKCSRVINGCTIHDDNPKVPDIGAVASSGSQETKPIDATTKFTLQCPGAEDDSVIVSLFKPFIKEVRP